MDHKQAALDYFGRGLHCSQAVLAAFAEECGITEEQALRLGSCFGSGMRKGQVCGACTGALMALGLMYGFTEGGGEDKLRADEVNDMMMDRFAGSCGSFLCNEILGCDISTAEGVAYASEKRLFTELCPRMVAAAAEIVEGIVQEMGAPEGGKTRGPRFALPAFVRDVTAIRFYTIQTIASHTEVDDMNRKNATIAVVAAAAIVAILACCMFVYGGDDDRIDPSNGRAQIELTFTIDESKLKVVCGSQVIRDKDTVTFDGDAELTVTTLDGKRHDISYDGSWSNGSGESGGSSGSELTNNALIYISDNIFISKATGTMRISCDVDDP